MTRSTRSNDAIPDIILTQCNELQKHPTATHLSETLAAAHEFCRKNGLVCDPAPIRGLFELSRRLTLTRVKSDDLSPHGTPEQILGEVRSLLACAPQILSLRTVSCSAKPDAVSCYSIPELWLNATPLSACVKRFDPAARSRGLSQFKALCRMVTAVDRSVGTRYGERLIPGRLALEVMRDLVSHPDAVSFLDVHTSGGTSWFNRERYGETVLWGTLLTALEAATRGTFDTDAAACTKLLSLWLEARNHSAYQVESLIRSLETAHR